MEMGGLEFVERWSKGNLRGSRNINALENIRVKMGQYEPSDPWPIS